MNGFSRHTIAATRTFARVIRAATRTGLPVGELHPSASLETPSTSLVAAASTTPAHSAPVWSPADVQTGGASPFMSQLGPLLDGDETTDPVALPSRRMCTLLRGFWLGTLQVAPRRRSPHTKATTSSPHRPVAMHHRSQTQLDQAKAAYSKHLAVVDAAADRAAKAARTAARQASDDKEKVDALTKVIELLATWAPPPDGVKDGNLLRGLGGYAAGVTGPADLAELQAITTVRRDIVTLWRAGGAADGPALERWCHAAASWRGTESPSQAKAMLYYIPNAHVCLDRKMGSLWGASHGLMRREVAGLGDEGAALERAALIGSLATLASFESQARLVGISSEIWAERGSAEEPLLRTGLLNVLECDVPDEVKQDRIAMERQVRSRSRASCRLHCYDKLPRAENHHKMILRDRIKECLSRPAAVLQAACRSPLVETLERLAPRTVANKQDTLHGTILAHEMAPIILSIFEARRIDRTRLPLLVRALPSRPMGESKGLPILYLTGALFVTKTGEVMNLAAETIQSSVEGVPLVSNRGKDDKGKKATAAGEKHAIALLDGALDARQQAMVAEIDAHMHHPSVAPHAASLRKLNVIPEDCVPTPEDDELLGCDGAQLWLVWLIWLLRSKLPSLTAVEARATQYILQDVLIAKVEAKGGGEHGWQPQMATAAELTALRDPPAPTLRPSPVRVSDRKVRSASNSTPPHRHAARHAARMLHAATSSRVCVLPVPCRCQHPCAMQSAAWKRRWSCATRRRRRRFSSTSTSCVTNEQPQPPTPSPLETHRGE